MLKKALAISLGKSIFSLSRILKLGGGHAAPGLYALKLYPDLISNLTSQIPINIMITGTNGKTTTSGMLSHLYKHSNQKVIHNSTGSNLERGIASTLLNSVSNTGKINASVAIWEVDEAAFNSLAPKIKPDLVVFLNAFRDQLDRYGEVDTVVNKWVKTIAALPEKTQYLINGDDGSLTPIIKAAKNLFTYSVKGVFINSEKTALKTPIPRFIALHIKKDGSSSNFIFRLDDCRMKVTLPMIGDYNIYNATAALSAKFLLDGLSDSDAASLKDFRSAFGRHEQFTLGSKSGNIFLIKNPVGATEVLKTISSHITQKDTLLVALNDNFADGTDVSWIWDIDFQNLKLAHPSEGGKIENLKLFVTGSRAYDMALRFKYADFKNIQIEPTLKTAFNQSIKESNGKLFILPTYTALIELQKIMVKKGIKKEYWKES